MSLPRHPFRPSRRALLAGVGAAMLLRPGITPAAAQTMQRQQQLRLSDTKLQLGAPEAQTAGWRFNGDPFSWRFQKGETLELDLINAVTAPVSVNVYGLDGVPGLIPLLGQQPIPAGKRETRAIPLTRAGTYFFETRLGSDGAARPLPCGAFAVAEANPPQVDRDETLVIEDWRLTADRTALIPGASAAGAETVYTINDRLDWTIPVRRNQRLRLRFVNGCHRMPIALYVEGHKVRVMAIDGQPAEPFDARGATFVLAPGSRLDAMLDATLPPNSRLAIMLYDGTSPKTIARIQYSSEGPAREAPLPLSAALPDNGLPAQIPLANAQRSVLTLGTTADADWVTAERLSTKLAPAFRAKRGRSVVLALTNRAAQPVTFHMHGHHFRLLDRLDDGWKPFWLDTLLFDAGQTQRIAFLAEHSGNWLIETMGVDWSSPRLLRWFAIE
jgi:FtsP/CotA-like multicopper oxidase with cupredoxin domain